MRRVYDNFSPSSFLAENTSPVAPVYGGGGKKKSYAQRYEEEQRAKSAIESQFPVHVKLNDAERHSVSRLGSEYYDVVNMHYKNLMDRMKTRGFSYQEAQRLAPILTMQLIREGDWRTTHPFNNFGGMRVNNRTISFDTPDQFYDAYLDNLDQRWGKSRGALYNWRYSQDYLDYAKRINRDDLHLHTLEEYNAYNREHKDNPVYLYAPEWENNNNTYQHLLGQVRDRTNHYMRMILDEDPYTEDMFNDIPEPYIYNGGGEGGGSRADGGHKIHIKPENRGKFTALKKRTGKSASWFKAHGTPAQKKMATFALNSKKWHKKAHGGIKF